MRKAVNVRWLVIVGVVALLCLVVSGVAQQGRGGGRGGGFGGNAVFGTVSAVDVNTGVIGVQGQNDQQVWVAVTDQTQMSMSRQAGAADLQVGQQVTVSGQPTAIVANTVRIGEQGMFGGFGGGRAAGANNQAGNPAAPGGAGGGRGLQANAQVTGQIANLNPLTVAVEGGNPVAVTLPAEARISETLPATVQNVVIGDQLMAFGQPGEDGYYYAQVVRLGDIGRFMGGRGGGGRVPQGGQ